MKPFQSDVDRLKPELLFAIQRAKQSFPNMHNDYTIDDATDLVAGTVCNLVGIKGHRKNDACAILSCVYECEEEEIWKTLESLFPKPA